MRKIATLSPQTFKKSGIQKVERQFVEALENVEEHSFRSGDDVKVERVGYQYELPTFPFSRTIEILTKGHNLASRIPDDADVVFVPAQTRMEFNPDKVDAEVVCYVHDLFPMTHYMKMDKKVGGIDRVFDNIGYMIQRRRLQNLVKCDRILTPSKYVANDVITHTPFKGKIRVVGQGVDDLPEDLVPEAEGDEIHEDRDIDLLYVGSLQGRKNPQLIRKVFRKAKDEGLKVVSVNREPIDLPGATYTNLPDEKLAELYRRSRFYLHVSHAEGFGRCAVEAQRYGSIPLAFDLPVNNEILGDGYMPVANEVRDVLDIVREYESYQFSHRYTAVQNSKNHSWVSAINKFMHEVL